jgi:hypothetical protein
LIRHVLRIDPGPVPPSRQTLVSPAEKSGWEIKFTPQAERWYLGLDDRAAEAIAAAFDELARFGPATRRPSVGSIRGSRHHNMKEARSFGGNLRALFAFDRNRRGIVLVGGDKTGDWKGWYKRTIPLANKLYDNHLQSGGKGGRAWPIDRPGPGTRSVDSGR